MTWQAGRDKIAELLAAAELQQVTADHRIAELLLDDAGRHLVNATQAGRRPLVHIALYTGDPCRFRAVAGRAGWY